MENIFGMEFISPAREAVVLVPISLIFLMGISMSKRWGFWWLGGHRAHPEVFYWIFRSLVVCFEEGFSLKYKNVVVFLDFDGEQRT